MTSPSRRRLLATLGGGLVAGAGCLSRSDGGVLSGRGSEGGSDADPGNADGGNSSAAPPPTTDRSLPAAYTVDELADASRSGGPGPDGIPAIENPQFVAATDAPESLDDGDPVFGVSLDGEAHAYPQSILVWHEIVNDVIGDTPVSVTYCPLTGTTQGFYRGDTTFGVSGQLINANLVMFDRATESWWPQILATRITGAERGRHLDEFQVVWTTWGRWRSVHPDTVVLTEATGFARNYGRDPYGGYNPPSGYYMDDSFLFPPLAEDDRLAPKSVVIGMRSANGAVAVRKNTLRDERILEFETDGVRHTAVHDPALDTGWVYRVDGDQTIAWEDGAVVVDGSAHEPASLPFDREVAFDAMWFAWYGYYPMTDLYQ